MNRRKFISTLSSGSVIGLAGCTNLSPNIKFTKSLRPDVKRIDMNTNDEEYFTTIQNTGDNGYIRAELWHYKNKLVEDPSQPNPFIDGFNSLGSDSYFGNKNVVYFDSDERREISIYSDINYNNETNNTIYIDGEEYNIGNTQYDYFDFLIYPNTYGGRIRNTGSTGEVKFSLIFKEENKFTNNSKYNLKEPEPIYKVVEENEELDINFDILLPVGLEYEIKYDIVN